MPTPLRLTVCGSGNAGSAIAADCALNGLDVTLFELPELAAKLVPFQDPGGIEVTPDSDTVCGKTGLARLRRITADPAEAAGDADVIMITVPAMYHARFWEALAPHFQNGQIVLFNTGYWAALRFAEGWRAGGERVILAESNIMPYLCARDGRTVRIARHKRHFRVAAFPGDLTGHVHDTVRRIYPQYEAVSTVLDTNIASGGNPAFHVTLAIPIAGFYFDRYMGGKFYSDTTLMGGRLITAYDRDRERLARHLGSAHFQSITEFESRSYEYQGPDIVAMLRRSAHIDWFATADYLEQVIAEDIRYAYVPMVLLAESLGVPVPALRAMVEITGLMLNRDYWGTGLTLADLGLAGMDRRAILEYARKGRR